MPSGLVSERPSMSMSMRVTSYVMTSCSYAAAIWLTSLHESPISVPPWSADQPPSDGMTSPPVARSAWMSDRNGVGVVATVCVFEPFQARVHEVLLVVSRKARVRYFAPDWAAMPEMLSPVHISKYGEKTWAGMGVAAPTPAGAAIARVARRDAMVRKRRERMSSPCLVADLCAAGPPALLSRRSDRPMWGDYGAASYSRKPGAGRARRARRASRMNPARSERR